MKEKEYRIGDVAKILGISPDLLRYYEKKGVVKPKKDRSNDYRYYESWDINFLIDCLWFKNFGFGIEQVAHIVSSCGYDEVLSLMEDKKEELQASIRRQQLLVRRAEKYQAEVSRARDFIGKLDIVDSPEIVRYLNRYNFIYDNSPELQALSHQWLEYTPLTHRCFEVELSDLMDHRDNYAWGFSLDMDYVQELQVPVEPPVAHLPSVKSLHSVFTSAGKANFSPQLLDYMLAYARTHGLTPVGNARGNLVCSVVVDGTLTGFFEVWIPVEERGAQDAAAESPAPDLQGALQNTP